MGAYSPVPQFKQKDIDEAVASVLQPTAEAMLAEGRPLTGILYAGLMMTDLGPKVIEFNVRFGDPETQVVLPRLESDLIDAIETLLDNRSPQLHWTEEAIVGIVMASKGYPKAYENGAVIEGLGQVDQDALLFHAGTKKVKEQWQTNGGRVLLIAARGDTISVAQEKAYRSIKTIHCPQLFYRSDIAKKAISNAFS